MKLPWAPFHISFVQTQTFGHRVSSCSRDCCASVPASSRLSAVWNPAVSSHTGSNGTHSITTNYSCLFVCVHMFVDSVCSGQAAVGSSSGTPDSRSLFALKSAAERKRGRERKGKKKWVRPASELKAEHDEMHASKKDFWWFGQCFYCTGVWPLREAFELPCETQHWTTI